MKVFLIPEMKMDFIHYNRCDLLFFYHKKVYKKLCLYLHNNHQVVTISLTTHSLQKDYNIKTKNNTIIVLNIVYYQQTLQS